MKGLRQILNHWCLLVSSALNQSCGSVVVEHSVSTNFPLYTEFIKEDIVMMSTFQILQITVKM